MRGSDYVKMFLAGLAFPGVVFPLVCLFLAAVQGFAVLQVMPMYLIGVIWGCWNLVYFLFIKAHIDHVPNTRVVFGLHGVVLGLLLYVTGVVVLKLPVVLALPAWITYSLIFLIPIGYYFVWYYVVYWLNDIMNFRV